jgi:signal transduction histidine kinase
MERAGHVGKRVNRAMQPINKPQTASILVVDDDPVLCQTATVFLGMAGHKVISASSVDEALSRCAATVFDIAIVDFEMAGANGLEFLAACREKGLLRQMPVIMMTSRDDMPVIDRAFELGASGFTVKPANWRLLEHQARFILRAASNERVAEAARDEAIRLSTLKDELLSLARHELRTPLNAVVGFGRMIATEAAAHADRTIESHAREVVAAGQRLDGILGDIQIFLDHRAGRLSTNRQSERAAWILDAFMADPAVKATPAGVTLTIVDDTAQARFTVDAAQIHDALRRLAINAYRYAAGATRVTVTALNDNRGNIVLAVSDDGEGIPEDQLLQVMEPFAQADTSHTRNIGGLGLGLPITRALAEMNGGTFALSSKTGQGTTAVMAFPREG